MPRKEKWCHVCGSQIHKNTIKLSEQFCDMANIKNPEYKYIHKECYKEFKKSTNF
jgi:hypothetical protein